MVSEISTNGFSSDFFIRNCPLVAEGFNCANTIFTAMAPCFDNDTSVFNIGGLDPLKKLLNKVCENNGQDVQSIFSNDGFNCFKKIEICVYNFVESLEIKYGRLVTMFYLTKDSKV